MSGQTQFEPHDPSLQTPPAAHREDHEKEKVEPVVEKTAGKTAVVAAKWVIAKVSDGGKAVVKQLSRRERDSLSTPHCELPGAHASLTQRFINVINSTKIRLGLHREDGGKLRKRSDTQTKSYVETPLTREEAQTALTTKFKGKLEVLSAQEDLLHSAKKGLEDEKSKPEGMQNQGLMNYFKAEIKERESEIGKIRDELKKDIKDHYSTQGARAVVLVLEEAAQDPALPSPRILKGIYEEIDTQKATDALMGELGDAYSRITEQRDHIKKSEVDLQGMQDRPDNEVHDSIKDTENIIALHESIQIAENAVKTELASLKLSLKGKSSEQLTKIYENAQVLKDNDLIAIVKSSIDEKPKSDAKTALQKELGKEYELIHRDQSLIKGAEQKLEALKAGPATSDQQTKIAGLNEEIQKAKERVTKNTDLLKASLEGKTINDRARIYQLAKTAGDESLMDMVKTQNIEASLRDMITNPKHANHQALIEDSSILVKPEVIVGVMRKELEKIQKNPCAEGAEQRLHTVLSFAKEWVANTNMVPEFQNDEVVQNLDAMRSILLDKEFQEQFPKLKELIDGAEQAILANEIPEVSPVNIPTNPSNDIMKELQRVKSGELTIKSKEYTGLVESVAQDLTNAQVAIMQHLTPSDMAYISEGKTENLSQAGKLYLEMFNKTQTFIATTIVNETDPENAKNLMKFYLRVAEKCLENNDFATPLAISRACDSTPVKRLPGVKESETKKRILPKLDALYDMSNAYKNYKDALIKVQDKPYVPCALMTTSFLEFGNKGNPDFLNGKLNEYRLKVHHDQLSSFFSKRNDLKQEPAQTNVSEQILRTSSWEDSEKGLFARSLIASPKEKTEGAIFSRDDLRKPIRKQLENYTQANNYAAYFPVVEKFIENYVNEQIQKHPEYNDSEKSHQQELLFDKAFRFLNDQVKEGNLSISTVNPISEEALKEKLVDYL